MLLLNNKTCSNAIQSKQKYFCFQLGWLEYNVFIPTQTIPLHNINSTGFRIFIITLSFLKFQLFHYEMFKGK